MKWLKRLVLRWALNPGAEFERGMFRTHIGDVMIINVPETPPPNELGHDAVEAYICGDYAVLFYEKPQRWYNQHEIEELFGTDD